MVFSFISFFCFFSSCLSSGFFVFSRELVSSHLPVIFPGHPPWMSSPPWVDNFGLAMQVFLLATSRCVSVEHIGTWLFQVLAKNWIQSEWNHHNSYVLVKYDCGKVELWALILTNPNELNLVSQSWVAKIFVIMVLYCALSANAHGSSKSTS